MQFVGTKAGSEGKATLRARRAEARGEESHVRGVRSHMSKGSVNAYRIQRLDRSEKQISLRDLIPHTNFE